MSLWTNKDRRTELDNTGSYAYDSSGGRLKQWILGAIIPSFMLLYGITCLSSDETMISSPTGHVIAFGSAATGLVMAFIAFGLFLHFHFFWRLNERLEPYAERLKLVSLIVFLGGFLFGISRHAGIF